jgi:hypothetical protein
LASTPANGEDLNRSCYKHFTRKRVNSGAKGAFPDCGSFWHCTCRVPDLQLSLSLDWSNSRPLLAYQVDSHTVSLSGGAFMFTHLLSRGNHGVRFLVTELDIVQLSIEAAAR